MIKISIIIPVYNGEKHISRTIESVIKQPLFSQCEIVVVNDGSADKTTNVVETYCDKNSNIRILSQSNQGVSAARNRGIREAKGQYLLFLDADDYLVDGFLSEQLFFKLQQGYDIIMFSAYNSNEDRNRYGIDMKLRSMRLTGRGQIISIPGHFASGVYRKQHLVEQAIFFDEGVRLNEDQVFSLKALYTAEKIYIDEEFCYIYNKNKRSTTYNYFKGFDRVIAWKKAYEWFDQHAEQNRIQVLEFAKIKYNSRMLLYAKDYVQSGHISRNALKKELQRVNGLVLLQEIGNNQVQPYQKRDLYLFQNHIYRFIVYSFLEGMIIYGGRNLLKIPVVRKIKDKKQYPYVKISLRGPSLF